MRSFGPLLALATFLQLVSACSQTNDCPVEAPECPASCSPTRFARIDTTARCYAPSVVLGCAGGVGPPTHRCSIRESTGEWFLSGEGRVAPRARACTDAEATSIGFNTIGPCK